MQFTEAIEEVEAKRERPGEVVNGFEVIVEKIPACDVCGERDVVTPAVVDGRTVMGPWAYMCEEHFCLYAVGLGVGRGQRLVKRGD